MTMLTATTDQALRSALGAALAHARRQTDVLFDLVRPAALYRRPIPERHRLIFYLGHLEAFDWNLLCRDALGREPFDASHDRLFAFGIDPLDGLPSDEPGDWPSVGEVRSYASRVRAALDDALADVRLVRAPSPWLERGWAIHLAIEHRLMHAETLAYLLHELPFEAKLPGPAPDPAAPAAARRLVPIPRGCATLGLDRARNPTLGWDNEYQLLRVDVPAFAIESHPVSCGEFLRFVQEGGYQEPSLWTEEAWAWRCACELEHPHRWLERAGSWWYRTMFAEVPLPLSWPVYVSHAEASAYARWVGRRLPSEAEFHRAAYATPEGVTRAYPWGSAEPEPRHGVFGFATWDPEPIGSRPDGDSAFGVGDLVGNGWEWTRTPFAPFPGFEPLPFYPGYSADFFDARHFVLKGGSPRTDVSLLRRSFRNWFQPHYPYVYAGFRCVEDRG
jgi:ergothioneine biosynthesis protein EgtB